MRMTVTGILNGIFHHRIEYPESVSKGGDRSKKSEIKDSAKTESGVQAHVDTVEQPSETPEIQESATKKSGGENIKRLGMS